MQVWSSEIKDVEKLYDSFKGNFPLLEKEVEQLIKTDDANVAMLYSRRSLEVIVTDLCEVDLKRPRKTQPLKGIIDKLNSEEKVPSHIITSMDGLNSLSAYGAHPKDFDPEQVKPVLNNLTTIIKWYLKHRNLGDSGYPKPDEAKLSVKPQFSGMRYPNRKIIFTSLIAFSIVVLACLIVYEITKTPIATERTIAVLPFKNMSQNPDYSFLGDALTQELIIQLWKVKQFDVLPINSVQQYRETTMKSRPLSRELKVNYLVAGSIQRLDNQVIIRAWLIDGANEKQLWTDRYDRKWEELASVQSEITKQIAAALQTELTPEEVRKIEKQLTKNSDAYATLLSGNSLLNDARYYVQTGMRYNDSSSFINAIKAYDKAISYDSTYALAYAKRAISRSWGYHTGDLDNSNIDKCRTDIDRAIRLDPELPEGYIALGFYYYYCKDEFKKAVDSFQKASDLEPENSEPLYYMGVVYRRLGDWEKSCHFMTAGLSHSFSNPVIITNIGITYDYLRNYDSSMFYHKKTIEAMPGWPDSYGNLIETYLLRNGRTKEANIVLDSAITRTGRPFPDIKIKFAIYDGKYTEALKLLESSKGTDFEDPGNRFISYAQVYCYLDNLKNGFIYYDSARIYYNRELSRNEKNTRILSSLGIALAGLKEKNKSIELGEEAVKLSEYDAVKYIDRKTDLAKIYVMLEEYDRAMNLVGDLLLHPACISVKSLQMDPFWRKLVKRKQFQEFIIKNGLK